MESTTLLGYYRILSVIGKAPNFIAYKVANIRTGKIRVLTEMDWDNPP